MQHANDANFLRQVGIPRGNFETILAKVKAHLEAERTRNRMKQRGLNTSELPVEDRLLLTLYYLRHHPTFRNLADIFDISESYANKRYHEYLDILVKVLRLPGRKALRDEAWMAVIIDGDRATHRTSWDEAAALVFREEKAAYRHGATHRVSVHITDSLGHLRKRPDGGYYVTETE